MLAVAKARQPIKQEEEGERDRERKIREEGARKSGQRLEGKEAQMKAKKRGEIEVSNT